jgi:hypothetical protein
MDKAQDAHLPEQRSSVAQYLTANASNVFALA